MRGIAKHTQAIIESISRLDCMKGWILAGGTALAIQLDHRKSEDLDFMRWQSSKGEKMDVDWPTIQLQLDGIGNVQSVDILEYNHVVFVVSGVKLSFYARESRSPVKQPLPFLNHIVLADIEAIAAMKIEVMLRRSKFRDYYDIYCILLEDKNVMKFVQAAGAYCNHKIKSRNFLAMLTNHHYFEPDSRFDQLDPKYVITPQEIETYIKSLIIHYPNLS